MDMSRVSTVDLDFPVLFPIVDIPNHLPDAKMDWTYDPGVFSIALAGSVTAGSQIYNNYGPKGNDELLLGYGFCLLNNPFDKVLLTLKQPTPELQRDIRSVHSGYFTQDGVWNSEKATFGIGRCVLDREDPSKIYTQWPEPLIEFLLYILRHERGLPFTFIQHPVAYLTSTDSVGSRYQPHLLRAIVQSLAPKLAKLRSAELSSPTNHKQIQAETYRESQVQILDSIINGCRDFLRLDFRPQNPELRFSRGRGMLLTLEEILTIAGKSKHVGRMDGFLAGIAQSAGTDHVLQLRQAGWEEDVLALLLCHLSLDGWTQSPNPEYLTDIKFDAEEMEHAQGLYDIVRTAAQQLPDSLWHDQKWSAPFIAAHGGLIMKYDSFMMMVPNAHSESEEARLVVYLHGLQQS
jgi:hypothetical protein